MADVIFHIDLNAFFASAEVVNNPQLANKPIAVGGSGRKGIISTASYEARAYGVKSAMPVFLALEKCPDLIVVPSNFELYHRLSNTFMNLIKEYTPLIEQASIDECYADMSNAIKKFPKPLDLAIDIQKKLKESTGLTCSIGIAPNKFLAKVASDLKKPNGITVLRLKEVESKLWPLDISAMGGIGHKTAPQLKKHGITKIKDLANEENKYIVYSVLGNNAQTFIDYAHGIDNSKIVNSHESKSMSTSTTLSENIINYEDIKKVFMELSNDLSRRLIKDKVCGNNISIVVKYFDFKSITRSSQLDEYVNSYNDLLDHALNLFELHDKQIPIRLLGLGVNNLKDDKYLTHFTLFNYSNETNKTQVDNIIDLLNKELPNAHIKKLSDLKVNEEFNGIFKK